MSNSGRSMRRRRLARALRQYRAATGMSGEDAAKALLCGSGTVSRMENGESAEPLRVRDALRLYGAPEAVIDEMVQIALDGRKRSKPGVIRRPYQDVVPKRLAEYYELEDEAEMASKLEGEFVPGLIQTEAYARALIGAGEPDDEVDRLVSIRMDRKRLLTGDHPLRFRVALGEAALLTAVGGLKVMREQLDHLAALAREAPNVQIRVLPFSAGTRPALGRNFTILSFPDEADPDVIFAESVTYFVIEDEAEEVERFRNAYNRIWDMALDEGRSARLIAQAASKLKR
ncbi:MAG: helix-turn-helix domain-containing protein [Actinophytocola sp.]|uniref:helix-turn-helix domain-containing protein n=1 Tax=Actinophytocola sp. TaxID=1872138 RepID=UPI001320C79D|nr:helix-turn-helix transcriptional regulator [Actinophytocola sp.]MPZ85238.1 helix-turn-helix domain-containing protein [Actinophytocola sp.]